jgi:hypothetical protein
MPCGMHISAVFIIAPRGALRREVDQLENAEA